MKKKFIRYFIWIIYCFSAIILSAEFAVRLEESGIFRFDYDSYAFTLGACIISFGLTLYFSLSAVRNHSTREFWRMTINSIFHFLIAMSIIIGLLTYFYNMEIALVLKDFCSLLLPVPILIIIDITCRIKQSV